MNIVLWNVDEIGIGIGIGIYLSIYVVPVQATDLKGFNSPFMALSQIEVFG